MHSEVVVMNERELMKIESRALNWEQDLGRVSKQKMISNYDLENKIPEKEYTPEELELTEEN